MVACHLWMYSLIWDIPASSSALSTGDYSHSLSSICRSVIPTILRAAWVWKPYNTLRISPITTKRYLPYSSTVCTTALNIIPRACTVTSVLASTFEITPQRCRSFRRLWYTASQLLLLYAMVRLSQGKAYTSSSGSIHFENFYHHHQTLSPI